MVVGPSATMPCRVAASATRFEAGEPLYSTATLSAGVASANTFVLAAVDFVTNGTNWFGGIALKGAVPYSTGTLTAQQAECARPIPYAGRLRGTAETKASIDTDAELLAILQDTTRVDYDATGATDGGELYTIKQTASVDTDLFTIVDGNITKGTLDVLVDPLAYRIDNDYAT